VRPGWPGTAGGRPCSPRSPTRQLAKQGQVWCAPALLAA
jgi:hypothetical protein